MRLPNHDVPRWGRDRRWAGGQSTSVRVVVVAGPDGGCWLSEFAGDETGPGRIVWHEDLPAAVAERERAGDVRWVWAAGGDIYPALLRAGDGRLGEPASLAGAWARLGGAAGSGLALRGAAGSGPALGGAAGLGPA